MSNSINKKLHSVRALQEIERKFNQERGWDRFTPSQIFIHLIAELGEIGSHLLWQSGYKSEEIGHKKPESENNLESEFAQCFSLFLHLANTLEIDLQNAFLDERERMISRFSKK